VRQVAAACALPRAGWELQQLAQRGGTRPLESRAHGRLGRFQIDAPVLRGARNITRKNCSTSRVISCRTASTVFFQFRFCLLTRKGY
jgi:hypothetical protein